MKTPFASARPWAYPGFLGVGRRLFEGESPILATLVDAPERTARLVPAGDPLEREALSGTLDLLLLEPETPPGGGGRPVVRVFGGDVVDAAGGPGAVRDFLRGLRSRGVPTALPAEYAGTGDGRDDPDVVVAGLPDGAANAAGATLRAGVVAAGRPVLVDVRRPEAEAEEVVAALDVGAAGALIRTGDSDRDAALVAVVAARERERLAGAPLFSVVVCNHNGARYLDRCLSSLRGLRYPRYEVIVVDDGSADDSIAIARAYDVRVVELDRVGLARARNAGIEAAEGEFILFLDNDAAAEPHVLARLWRLMDRLGADGAGGPNLPFPDAGWQERVVSGAPGVPIPVVTRDGSALHLPGCNMAFRLEAVRAIGGFDLFFPGAGDDVDFGLRLIENGVKLLLHPEAVVWHHRRDTILGFLRQQFSYGGGAPRHQARYGTRGVIPVGRRSLLQRIDPRRPRPVFTGPQARQLYTITGENLHIDLPLKGLVLIVATTVLGTGPAAAVGRARAWLAGGWLAAASLCLLTIIRVPAFAPDPGLSGLAQRAATAALWLAQPLSRRLGEAAARRREAR